MFAFRSAEAERFHGGAEIPQFEDVRIKDLSKKKDGYENPSLKTGPSA
jgi:hypothetical protein